MSDGEAGSPERRRKLLQLASAAVFLAIVGVAVLIVVNATQSSGGNPEDLNGVKETNRKLAGIPQHGMVLGNPDAKVLLVEYGDLKCPVCATYSEQVLPGLIDSKVRSGAASIEFRNFTIIDEQSAPAGAAALAAGEQGRGWNFLEIFYRNQGFETDPYATDEFLTAVARAAGVRDIARWNRDRRSASLRDRVGETTDEAEQVGFTGTPSFAVGGPSTGGLEPVEAVSSPQEELEAAIDQARRAELT